jgi:hypothetical protein
MAIYPEHNWDAGRFVHVPRGYWSIVENQKKFFTELAKDLKLSSPTDWYQVSKKFVTEHGGKGLLNHHNQSLLQGTLFSKFNDSIALSAMHPAIKWESYKFNKPHHAEGARTSKSQILLRTILRRVSNLLQLV